MRQADRVALPKGTQDPGRKSTDFLWKTLNRTFSGGIQLKEIVSQVICLQSACEGYNTRVSSMAAFAYQSTCITAINLLM